MDAAYEANRTDPNFLLAFYAKLPLRCVSKDSLTLVRKNMDPAVPLFSCSPEPASRIEFLAGLLAER